MTVQLLIPPSTEQPAFDARALSIRERLIQYLAGENELAEFLDWYEPLSWEVAASGEAQKYPLVTDLDLTIAEFDAGHRSEDDLREMWRSLLRTTVVAAGKPPEGLQPVKTGASSEIEVRQLGVRPQPAHTRAAAGAS